MYYAGSSIFGALVGLAWRADGWGVTAASVGLLVAVALLLVGVAARTRRTRGTSPPGRVRRPRFTPTPTRAGRPAGTPAPGTSPPAC